MGSYKWGLSSAAVLRQLAGLLPHRVGHQGGVVTAVLVEGLLPLGGISRQPLGGKLAQQVVHFVAVRPDPGQTAGISR